MVSEEKTQELLIRLDERSRAIKNDIEELKTDISDMKSSQKRELEKFVTKEQFAPFARGVYTIVTSIVLSVVGGILSLLLSIKH